MRRRRIAVLALASVVAAGAGAAGEDFAGGPSVELEKRIEEYVEPLVAAGDFSGVVLVARGRDVLVRRAWGLAAAELGVPMSPDARFDIASLTKTFTSAAILELLAAGTLDLDDPLSRFVPELPRASEISLEDLLLHRSGLPEEADLPDYRERLHDSLTLEQSVLRLRGAGLRFSPGTESSYSNSGYQTLALVVERASGEPFDEFVSRTLLAPLGMEHTGSEPATPLVVGRVPGYEPGPPPAGVMPAPRLELSHEVGSGHLFSTADDLHHWLTAVDEGRLFDLHGQAYPYGWGRREYFGRRAIEQSGIVPGYLAEMLSFRDEKLHVIYLSNIQSGVVFGSLARGLAALALGLEAEPMGSPEPTGTMPAVRPIEGTFALQGPGKFSVVEGPGGLYLEWKSFAQRAYLQPLGADLFFDRKDNSVLAVRRDPTGRAEAVVWSPGPDETVSPRVDVP